MERIRKFLKICCIYIHNLADRVNYNIKNTLQGSLISLILSNIYLHAFDEYIVKELLLTYNRGKNRKALLVMLKGRVRFNYGTCH